jgi:hypothetical protein
MPAEQYADEVQKGALTTRRNIPEAELLFCACLNAT